MGPLMPDLLIISKETLEATCYLNSRLFKYAITLKLKNSTSQPEQFYTPVRPWVTNVQDTTVLALSTDPTVNAAAAVALKVIVS